MSKRVHEGGDVDERRAKLPKLGTLPVGRDYIRAVARFDRKISAALSAHLPIRALARMSEAAMPAVDVRHLVYCAAVQTHILDVLDVTGGGDAAPSIRALLIELSGADQTLTLDGFDVPKLVRTYAAVLDDLAHNMVAALAHHVTLYDTTGVFDTSDGQRLVSVAPFDTDAPLVYILPAEGRSIDRSVADDQVWQRPALFEVMLSADGAEEVGAAVLAAVEHLNQLFRERAATLFLRNQTRESADAFSGALAARLFDFFLSLLAGWSPHCALVLPVIHEDGSEQVYAAGGEVSMRTRGVWREDV